MTQERLYSALLVLYPKAFRREYLEQMMDAFRQLRLASRRGAIAFWIFILADLFRSLLTQHVDAFRSGTRQFAVEWAATCALGAVMTALVANALTWSFSYLYHPYLEGLVLPAWSYGALLGLGLGLVQSATLHRRFRVGLLWILTSAMATALGLHVAVAFAGVAGPVGYGIVLGGFVGGAQWLILRTRVRGAGWWVLGSTAALSLAVASCAAAIHATLRGMNPLSYEPAAFQPVAYRAAIAFLLRGLYGPTNRDDLAVEFAVMATCGLVIAAVTARPLSSVFGRRRQC